MLIRLIKKLIVPTILFLIFSYLNNRTEFYDRYFTDTIVSYIYYISGIGLWLVVGWILSISVNIIVWDEIFRKRKGIEPPDVIETLTFIAIFVFSAMGVVGIVFGQSITGIWAMTSVIMGVIGFSLKNLIADFFTGIAINLDQTFKVGEWVKVNDEEGKSVIGWIEEITWRTTRIGQFDGTTLIYPNNVMSKMSLRNLSMSGPERRLSTSFYIDPSIDVDKVLRALTAATRSVPGILSKKPSKVIMGEVTPQGIKYKIRFWVDPTKFPPGSVRNQLIYSVVQHLKQAHIPLFLNTDQYIASMPKRYVDLDAHREKIIEKIPSFKVLSPIEVEQISQSMIRHLIKEGQTIIRQNDAGDSLYILTEGVMNVYVFNPEQNAEIKAGQIYPGEFFGERSLMTGEKRTATVIAGSECVAYEITREQLAPIIKARPFLAEKISSLIVERDLKNSKTFATFSASQKKKEQAQKKSSFLDKVKEFFNLSQAEPISGSDPSNSPTAQDSDSNSSH